MKNLSTWHWTEARSGGGAWRGRALGLAVGVACLFLGVEEAGAWAWVQAQASQTTTPYYLGDTPELFWWFNAEGNGASCKQWSLTPNAGSYNWQAFPGAYGAYIRPEDPNNQGGNHEWKTHGFQLTSVGTWYYSLWLGWPTQPGGGVGDNGRYYNYNNNTWWEGAASVVNSPLTVLALNKPTGAKAVKSGDRAIQVSWTKGFSGVEKDTLVVRTESATPPTPVNGTTYNTGTSALGGYILHRGNATSATDTGLTLGKTYYYHLFAENWTYYSGAVTVSCALPKLNQGAVGLTPTSFVYSPGGQVLTGTGGSGTGGFSFSVASGGTGAGTISGTNKLIVTKCGTIKIQVTKAGDGTYNAASSTVTVTVEKAAQTVVGLPGSKVVTKGDAAFGLTAYSSVAVGAGGGSITYSSSKPAVASVAGAVVTPVGVGVAVITAKAAATDLYNAASATMTVTVRPAPPTGLQASGVTGTGFTAGWTGDGTAYTLQVTPCEAAGGDTPVYATETFGTKPEEVLKPKQTGTTAVNGWPVALAEANLGINSTATTGMPGTGHRLRWTPTSLGEATFGPIAVTGRVKMALSHWKETETSEVTVAWSTDGTTYTTPTLLDVSPDKQWVTTNLDLGTVNGSLWLKFKKGTTKSGAAAVDNIQLYTVGSGGPDWACGQAQTITGIGGTSQAVGGLENSKKYYFRVKVEASAGGESGWSETAEVTTAAGVTAPAVGGASVSDRGPGGAKVTARVTADGGAAPTGGGVEYQLVGGGGGWTKVALGAPPVVGSDFSVTLTGLAAASEYEARGYAMNSAGEGKGGAVRFWTLAADPTGGPGLTMGERLLARLTLSITRGAGSDKTLVVMRAGGAPTAGPTDGTTYTANLNFGATASSGALGGGRVIVAGEDTGEVTVTGLSPGTHYFAKAYAYNEGGNPATANYLLAPVAATDGWTLMAAPTGSVTALRASEVGTDRMTLTWVKGAGGGKTLIVVKEGGSCEANKPADGQGYGASSDWRNKGSEVGVGAYVVYAGDGTSVVLTGLNPGKKYYIRAYPYNEGENPATAHYRLTGAANTTAVTLAAAPGGQATGLAFSNRGTVTLTLGCTKGGGANVKGTLIVVKAGGAPTWVPANGQAYTGNVAWASATANADGSRVVYVGTAGSPKVDLTGLSAGTHYFAKAYAYNESGASTWSYKTDGAPVADMWTLAVTPTGCGAVADGKTLVRLTAGAAGAGNSGVMIVWKEGSAAVGAPTDGTSYAVGSAVGGGVVIYRGAVGELEHVVGSGKTHCYTFYGYTSGNIYSVGTTKSVGMGVFGANEIVDTFSYTNGVSLTGVGGEHWVGDGVWYNNADTAPGYFVTNFGFGTQTNYPAESGNAICVVPPNADTANVAKKIHRYLGKAWGAADGKIYFAYMMQYEWAGAKKHVGLMLEDGEGNEKLFIGAPTRDDTGESLKLGIDGTVGAPAPYELGAGSQYLIAGYYDWGVGKAYAKAFWLNGENGGQAVPREQPTVWDVEVGKAGATVGTIDTIGFTAGADVGYGCPGHVYFDEVRVASSWSKLINVAATKPAAPVAITAVADGCEMVRLTWTKDAAGDGVMLLATTNGAAADATVPTDGVRYMVGDAVGDARVIYKGVGAELEHVVCGGTSAKYAIWSYNVDDYYSAVAKTAAVETRNYGVGVGVETFSYTNGTAPGVAWVGGQGWGGNWTGSGGVWSAVRTNAVAGANFWEAVGNYPEQAGNVLKLADPGGAASGNVTRRLGTGFQGAANAVAGKVLYLAFRMSYQYVGLHKWAGMKLMGEGGVEQVFFGKGSDTATHQGTLGITVGGGQSTTWSGYTMNGTGTGAGNVYMVMGKIAWTGPGVANVYTKAIQVGTGLSFPVTEPTVWDASYVGARVGAVTDFAFTAGSSQANQMIGECYFDSLRFGTNWDALISAVAPERAWFEPAGEIGEKHLGDKVGFCFYSEPIGMGQSAEGAVSYDGGVTWGVGVGAEWKSNTPTASQWCIPVGREIQLTNVQAKVEVCGVVHGGGATVKTAVGTWYKVVALPAPTRASATGGTRQIGLGWTGAGYDVIVVRYTTPSSGGWDAPEGGVTYGTGDSTGNGTVVYRGNGTSFTDTGLGPNTTYYYGFYSENWSYYSGGRAEANATTVASGEVPMVVDGRADDWVGMPPTPENSARVDQGEYIWKDKAGDGRKNTPVCEGCDLQEFRVKADVGKIYFLAKVKVPTNAAVGGDFVTNTAVAIGLDTRRAGGSLRMNWLGDDANTFIGGGYYTNEAVGGHYPERQVALHHVSGTDGGSWQAEIYAEDGMSWYAPEVGWAVAVGTNGGYAYIEAGIPRGALNLAGLGAGVVATARMNVATFVNSGAWNNEGAGTVMFDTNTCNAVDMIGITQDFTRDDGGEASAWDEGLSGGDIDFWFDVRVGETKLAEHNKPTRPNLIAPVAEANTAASPTMTWGEASDGDGDVTGYLLEVSTNATFGMGAGGSTEGQAIACRVNLPKEVRSYRYMTSGEDYWWRVRARDTAGQLSSGETRHYHVVGKLDNDGPVAKLKYVGTNVTGYLWDAAYRADVENGGDALSVLDSECGGESIFGFVIEWEDPSGVYATNRVRERVVNYATGAGTNYSDPAYPAGVTAGSFAYNILSCYGESAANYAGRVSPNWDLMAINTNATEKPDPIAIQGGGGEVIYLEWTNRTLVTPTVTGAVEITGWMAEWGYDEPFRPTNTIVSNANNACTVMTNYWEGAFMLPKFDPDVSLYLTVSAEDACTKNEHNDDVAWSPWPKGNVPLDWGSYSGEYAEKKVSSGWCADGPNPMRNVTTNQLIKIDIRDNDINPPVASTNRWGGAAEGGTNYHPSLVVSSSGTIAQPPEWGSITEKLRYLGGNRQDTLYGITDGELFGEPLTFYFNVYDTYRWSGLQLGSTETTVVEGGYEQTNTAMIAAGWTTNWANYRGEGSTIVDGGRSNTTVAVWQWGRMETADVTALWGAKSLGELGAETGVTNVIQLHAFDSDANRAGDQASGLIRFGRIRLTDDDAEAPLLSALQVKGNGIGASLTLLARWGLLGSDLGCTEVATNGVGEALLAGEGATAANEASGEVKAGAAGAYIGHRWVAGVKSGVSFKLSGAAGQSVSFEPRIVGFESKVGGNGATNGPQCWALYVSESPTWDESARELCAGSFDLSLDGDGSCAASTFSRQSGQIGGVGAGGEATYYHLMAWRTNESEAGSRPSWYVRDFTLEGCLWNAGDGEKVTDHDLAWGGASFELRGRDDGSGLYVTGEYAKVTFTTNGAGEVTYEIEEGDASPRLDVTATVGGGVALGDHPLVVSGATNGTGKGSEVALTAVNTGLGVDRKKIQLNTGGAKKAYKGVVRVMDYDNDRAGDPLEGRVEASFDVYDDDAQSPALSAAQGGSAFGVYTNGGAVKRFATTSSVQGVARREYRITDSDLEGLGTDAVSFGLSLWDYSGWEKPEMEWSRDGGAWAGIEGTGGATFQAERFAATNTANDANATAYWTVPMGKINEWLNAAYATNGFATTLAMRIGSVKDKDNDRLGANGENIDALVREDVVVGSVMFLDDDSGAPSMQHKWNAGALGGAGEWRIPAVWLGVPNAAGSTNLLWNRELVDDPEGHPDVVNEAIVSRAYDSELAEIAGAGGKGLHITLPAFDLSGGYIGQSQKGLQRGTAETVRAGGVTLTNSWLTVGDFAVRDRAHYDAGLSSPDNDTKLAARFPTSVWTWAASEFSYEGLTNWLGADEGYRALPLSARFYDADSNRAGDQRHADFAVGTLEIADDDFTAPESPSFTLLGTGTNKVTFGKIAEWKFANNSTAVSAVLPNVVAGEIVGKKAGAGDPGDDAAEALKPSSGTNEVYLAGGMNGGTNRCGQAKYIQFTITTTNETTWLSEALTFNSRSTAQGPTQFTLTMGQVGQSERHEAGNGAPLTAGWEYGGHATNGTQGGSACHALTNCATDPATLTSPSFGTLEATSVRLEFKARWFKTGRFKAYVEYSVGGGDWVTARAIASNEFVNTYAGFTNNLPSGVLGAENVRVRVRADGSGITSGPATQEQGGILLQKVAIIVRQGETGERELGTVSIRKDMATEDAYAGNTWQLVVIPFEAVHGEPGATNTFRLYAYMATARPSEEGTGSYSGTGNWGISGLQLHGITYAPKGVEVSDEDMRTGDWTNRLEVMDGLMAGYDIRRSGLWVVSNAADGVEAQVPRFEMRYPTAYTAAAGESFWQTNYMLKRLTTASYTVLKNANFEEGAGVGWEVSGSGEILNDTESSGSVLVLKDGATAKQAVEFDRPEGSTGTVWIANFKARGGSGSASIVVCSNGVKVAGSSPIEVTVGGSETWVTYTSGQHHLGVTGQKAGANGFVVEVKAGAGQEVWLSDISARAEIVEEGVEGTNQTGLRNGDFLAGTNDWVITGDGGTQTGGTVYKGAYALKLGAGGVAEQTVVLERPEEGGTGVTVSGTLWIKGAGGTVQVGLGMLDGGGGVLQGHTNGLAGTGEWRQVDIEPFTVTRADVEKLKVTIGATGGEVLVDEVAFSIATWGQEIASDDAHCTNGIPAAKFLLGTGASANEETGLLEIPISEDAGLSWQYHLVAKVSDHDFDRAGDHRTVLMTNDFTLYDDDEIAPQEGWMYGGPMGVRVGEQILATANGSGLGREWRVSDHALAEAEDDGETSFRYELDYYDYSGWTASKFTVGEQAIQDGETTKAGFERVIGVGAANSPGALNVWETTITNILSLHRAGFDLAGGQTNAVYAAVVDFDHDRVADDMTNVWKRVGWVTFLDQDDGAPKFRTVKVDNWGATNQPAIRQMVVATNVPGKGALTNVAMMADCAVKGEETYEAYWKAEASVRAAATVYDSDLRRTRPDARFVVAADLVDPTMPKTGQSNTGVKRGTGETDTRMHGAVAVTLTNTYLAFERADGGGTNLVARGNYTADWSGTDAMTRQSINGVYSTWTWEHFSYDEMSGLLPAGAVELANRLVFHTWDADGDREGDQEYVRIEGSLLTLRDNDTVAPGDISGEGITVNGVTVPASAGSRDELPWTTNPVSIVRFKPVEDGAKAAGDKERSGIGGYRVFQSTDGTTLGAFNGLSAAVRAQKGNGQPVAVVTGALANAGFEESGADGKPRGWACGEEGAVMVMHGETNGAQVVNYAPEGNSYVKLGGQGATVWQTIELGDLAAGSNLTFGLTWEGSSWGAGSGAAGDMRVSVVFTDGAGVETVREMDGGAAAVAWESKGWTGEATIPSTALNMTVKFTTGGAGQALLDDVQLNIFGIGDEEMVPMTFTATEQGATTNFLFAVDRDNDRAGDQLAGGAQQFFTAWDITKPVSVAANSFAATTETVDDPTCMMDLSWNATGMGPDDPSRTEGKGNDVYSPWASYKVYYRAYEPTEDPATVNDEVVREAIGSFEAAGGRTWDFITATNNAEHYGALTNAATAAIRLQDLEPGENYIFAIVGLDKAGNESEMPRYVVNDTIKFMVTQGVIRAWADLSEELNEGRFGANIFAPENTNGTRGAPTLYWDARINASSRLANRAYSLVYRDGTTFQEGTNLYAGGIQQWGEKAGHSISNYYYADPRGDPLQFERGKMRYYRATYAGRERKTESVMPLASEEVYALHNVKLSEGRNFVALHGLPYTNTFRALFGVDTNTWPAGNSEADSTTIEFFTAVSNMTHLAATERYFLAAEGPKWVSADGGGDVTDVIQETNFFARGFSIRIPTNAADSYFTGETVTFKTYGGEDTSGVPVWVDETARVYDWSPILRMPTNGFSVQVACGTTRVQGVGPWAKGNPVYVNTPVAFVAPASVSPDELQLPLQAYRAGMTVTGFVYNTASPKLSDKIVTIVPARKRARFSDEAASLGREASSGISDIYYDGTHWRWYRYENRNADNPIVSGKVFKPNDVIIIKSCNGGTGNSWTWTYMPTNLYEGIPDRHMGW